MDILEWCEKRIPLNGFVCHGNNNTDSEESSINDILGYIKNYISLVLIEEVKITDIGETLDWYKIGMRIEINSKNIETDVYTCKKDILAYIKNRLNGYNVEKFQLNEQDYSTQYSTEKFISVLMANYIIVNNLWRSPFISDDFGLFNRQYELRRSEFLRQRDLRKNAF